jgi:transcriptional regulator with XRE-family HTH domain
MKENVNPQQHSWEAVSELIARYGNQENAAKRIREWAEAKGWSGQTLAEKVNMSQSSVWKIMNPDRPSGSRNLSIKDAINFSRVFEKSLAEILLPDGAVLHLDGWTAFLESTESLNKVRQTTSEYGDAILKTRARIKESPALRQRIEEWLAGAKISLREQALPAWEIQGGKHGKEPFLEDYVKTFDTPAVIAAEDALGDHPINESLWTQTQTGRTS